jgi:hypothetical protein
MLSERQKNKVTNSVIAGLLKSGIYPTWTKILSGITAVMRGKSWGKPTAALRPAIQGYKVGGLDGKDIERTYEELRSDMELYTEASVSLADTMLVTYDTFEAKLSLIKSRLSNLIQLSRGAVEAFVNGSWIVIQDTFNTSSKIDMLKTDAEVNLDAGYVTLPTSMKELIPLGANSIRVDKEEYPGDGLHGNLMSALSDASNTAWYASLGGGTFAGTFSFLGEDGATKTTMLNGIYVDPLTPLTIIIQYSSDGYNFTDLTPAEKIYQAKTWNFGNVDACSLRIMVSGKSVGIRRIQPLRAGYANKATLYSSSMMAADISNKPVPIETVKLSVEADLPAGTNISYKVAPVTTEGKVGTFVSLDTNPITLSQASTKTFSVKTVKADNASATRKFYVAWLAASSGIPMLSTGELTRGANQIYADYTNYNWESDEGSLVHLPYAADWSRLPTATSGYFRTLPYEVGEDPLLDGERPFGSNASSSYKGMLYQADQVYPDLPVGSTVSSVEQQKWLGIAVRCSGAYVMNPYGNYRFTFYIYMPEETILTNQACTVLNLGGSASGDTPIVPVSVYLNDEAVATYYSCSASAITSPTQLDFKANYSFKAGWNKLQILVYVRTGLVDGIGDNIGILIEPNPFKLAADNPAIKIQTDPGSMKRVSEFQLRNTVKSGDIGSWAWLDRTTGTYPYGVMFNHNPTTITGKLDTITTPVAPSLQLTYRQDSANHARGLIFRADLEKEISSMNVPKLYSYKLHIN